MKWLCNLLKDPLAWVRLIIAVSILLSLVGIYYGQRCAAACETRGHAHSNTQVWGYFEVACQCMAPVGEPFEP